MSVFNSLLQVRAADPVDCCVGDSGSILSKGKGCPVLQGAISAETLRHASIF